MPSAASSAQAVSTFDRRSNAIQTRLGRQEGLGIIILHAKGKYTQRMLYGAGHLRTYVNSSHSSVISIETKFDCILVDRRKITCC